MFSMNETCKLTNMTYETLKYYCNEGLIHNVKRDKNNYRIFDDKDISWIKSLSCLKQCGMGISEMKQYVQLCMEGDTSIPKRQAILDHKKILLVAKLKEIEESLQFIETKQQFYKDVITGKVTTKGSND
ncbi:HTH-type transcriptional regulator AdhR [bioreactor metagenome]|uniref:HTH-type transcriptional regulator AdhR n=1 Tax=bioreactor metagenome TaxID=1076179 RepID=A0A645A5J4_9ZZZZ